MPLNLQLSGSIEGGGPTGTVFNSFRLFVTNDGGTVKHLFDVFDGDLSSGGPASALTAPSINSPLRTLTTTPNGPVASTAFANGAMIPTDGTFPGSICLDVPDIADGKSSWGVLYTTNIAACPHGFAGVGTDTINGVSRYRLYLHAKNFTNVTQVLPGTLAASGNFFMVDFQGYLPPF